jgi:hypothetical protein
MYTIPLVPLVPLVYLLGTLPVARKLTPFVLSVAHELPFTQNPDPPGFTDPNIYLIRMTL